MNSFEKLGRRYLNNVYIVLFIEILIVKGPYSAVSKLVLKKLDGFQTQFFMFGIALVIYTLVLNKKILGIKMLKLKEIIQIIFKSAPYYLSFLFMLLALKTTPAIEVSMLVNLYPVIMILLSSIINNEKLRLINIIAVFAGFAGGLIILFNGNFSFVRMTNFTGDLFAIESAVSYALFSIFSRRGTADVILSNYINIFISFILSVIFMFAFSSIVLPDKGSVAGLLWIGTVNGVASLFLWVRALQLASSSMIASAVFLVPFASLAYISLILGESISRTQFVGFAIIIGSIILQNLSLRNRRKIQQQ